MYLTSKQILINALHDFKKVLKTLKCIRVGTNETFDHLKHFPARPKIMVET